MSPVEPEFLLEMKEMYLIKLMKRFKAGDESLLKLSMIPDVPAKNFKVLLLENKII